MGAGHLTRNNLTDVPNLFYHSEVPGLQYIVVDANGCLFEYAGGWAEIQKRRAMSLDTTLMAYSMTKTFTVVSILQLVEQGKLDLDDKLDVYLPDNPYRDHSITIRQLLDHTSGFPNPVPLRWVHLAEKDADFDENAALAKVLRDSPSLAFMPGRKFAYSNIGYWLLGRIVEHVTRQSFPNYVRANILGPLGLLPQAMDFVISNSTRHANGYLARYSLINLLKRFFIDREFWEEYEGKWLRLRAHYLNGPSFGGLVGTARGFSRFLQDQLSAESVLIGPKSRRLLETQQTTSDGTLIPMTLGWHIGQTEGVSYLFKEGGGGGFHSEMRLYRTQGIGTVVMTNRTEFNSTRFPNRTDYPWIGA